MGFFIGVILIVVTIIIELTCAYIVAHINKNVFGKKLGSFTYYTYKDRMGTKYLVSRSRKTDRWKNVDFSHYVVDSTNSQNNEKVKAKEIDIYDPKYEVVDIGLYLGMQELEGKINHFQDENNLSDSAKEKMAIEEIIYNKMQRKIKRLKMAYPVIYLDENNDIDYHKIKTVVSNDKVHTLISLITSTVAAILVLIPLTTMILLIGESTIKFYL